jgi:CRISPR system Cascade subunit CasC
MFIEVHTLQNFSPSCLNRDDTNSPKDCEFGGHRRARISSQCIKRSIRKHFQAAHLLPDDNLAHRTKRLVEELARRLGELGHAGPEVGTAVEAAVQGAGLGLKEGKTQYLLFLGEREIDGLAALIHKHFDALAAVKPVPPPAAEDADEGNKKKEKKEKKDKKKEKKEAKAAVPKAVADAALALLDGGKSADLALFGRMLADLPHKNREAACQVAHAFSTNRAHIEMDYYTAVDDLKPEDTAGADMIGTVEFTAPCFYRYANIDFDQLTGNLQNDRELALKTVEAFLRAAVEAIPTGKQNSMAAHNPPDLVFVVVRERGLWSLANAFVQPIRPDRDGDLTQRSAEALDRYWGRLARMYPDAGVIAAAVCVSDEGWKLPALADHRVATMNDVVGCVRKAIQEEEAK